MPNEFPLGFVSIKSFGDLVIAHSILQHVVANNSTRIIAGEHLIDLANALPGNVPVTSLPIGDEGYPSLFDIRKRGLMRGLYSAIVLRRELMRLHSQNQEMLVFDCLGFRARFVAGSWPALSLPPNASNIYLAYLAFLADRDIATTFSLERTFRLAGCRVGIFPTSRVTRKNIPIEILNAVVSLVSKTGLNTIVFRLEGDPKMELAREPPTTIAKNFGSLMDAIQSVDCVISADSLPAHLAEYVDRPVFVVSPSPNQYWLPYRCFINGYWGIFADTRGLGISLGRFLSGLFLG